MASIFKRTLDFLGLAEDEDVDAPSPLRRTAVDQREAAEPMAGVRPLRRPSQPGPRSTDEADLVRTIPTRGVVASIHRCEPTHFDDVREIVERFKHGSAVIMNLADIEDAVLSRRVLDFVSGAVHGLDGKIEPIARKVFLVTPPNMEVSAEDRERFSRGELPPLF